jgi:anti-sigma regulatory factor (Ser/Thr protein kinase)
MKDPHAMHFDAAPYARVVGVPGSLGELMHHALIHGSDQEFLDGTLPTIHCGVQRGEPTLVIVGPERAELLRAALGTDAVAVEFADATQWFRVPGFVFGQYHRFVRQQRGDGGRLWVVAEPQWSGWSPGQRLEWQRCESITNVAFGWAPATVICTYDRRALPSSIIDVAHETHPALVAGARAVGSDRYVAPAQYNAEHQVPLPTPPDDADTLKFELGDLATVRSVATAWATRELFDTDQVRDLLIAVHEIASNAVEHGGGTGIVRFWGTEHELSCEVSSNGPLRQPYPGYLPPDTGQERGRGLWMARQICTRVDVLSRADAGVDVRITMPRSP